MTPFEEELKKAMQRREPSRNFTSRVLAKAASQSKLTAATRLGLALRRFRSFGLVPVTAALLAIAGAELYQQHQRAARGEAVKVKLLIAMRIAGDKLHYTQRRIFNIGNEEVAQ